MRSLLKHCVRSWTWRMAWRESRTRRARLALFASSMVIGIAALIAIGSFRDSVLRSIDQQARALLGADLVIAGRAQFGATEEALFQTIPGKQATETDLSSMVLFPASGGTRLIQLRALDGEFPFYGKLETEPANGIDTWREQGGFLVEESLMAQFGVKIGDLARVGELTAPVVGSLKRVPGDSLAVATFAPRVYTRASDLPKAKLLREGSLARYKRYFQLPVGIDPESVVQKNRSQLDLLRLGHTTVAKRKEDLGEALENLANFLSLVGFVALFLGGVGVGSAIHTHVKEKLPNVALLRCIGASESQTFAIYLAQALALGILSSTLGAILGLMIQSVLPTFVSGWLSFDISFAVGVRGIVEGFTLGLTFCLLFALLPLMAIRQASPLTTLRLAFGMEPSRRFPWAELGIGLLLVGISGGFAIQHSGKWTHGVAYVAGLLAAFAILAGMAQLAVRILRHSVPSWLPYPRRQGLANLHRPNNRTALLVLSLGLGTFVLVTLYLTQNVLLSQLVRESSKEGPNTVLFDIQSDQQTGVLEVLKQHGVPLLDQAPIVTMRLSKLKARSVEDLLGETNRSLAKWALRREYRSTWREQPSAGERVTRGVWHPTYRPEKDPIPVSLEEGIAHDLGLKLNDAIEFDLQGVKLSARVASLRKVEWRRVQPNFFVVFPPGSLDGAPAFHVFVTRTDTPKQAAALQRAIVEKFPNVSSIDLTLILNTVNAILNKVSTAIRFMALFTVATGLLVLAGAVLVSRHQRIKEGVLLRILGASRAQIRSILLTEYAGLGLLAAATGVTLATVAAWCLATYVFKTRFTVSLSALILPMIAVPGITMLTGWMSSRGVVEGAPLEVLRQEST